MHIRQSAIRAVLVVLLCTPGCALARDGGNWITIPDPRNPVLSTRVGIGPKRGARVDRHDMIQAGQTQCQATATDLEALRARLQAAQASNDLAHLRAVLDDVQRQLTAMQDHMAGCLNVMRTMPQGHSGMSAPAQQQ